MTLNSALILGIVIGLVAAFFAGQGLSKVLSVPGQRDRIGAIDGLRGFLALFVLAHHYARWMAIAYAGAAWEMPRLNLLNQLGKGGVALFFMTTGLVFSPRIAAGFRATSWGKVYIGRIFRITPMIVFVVVAVTMLEVCRLQRLPGPQFPLATFVWLTGHAMPPLVPGADSARDVAGVLWSIWHEWIFYLITLPLCALLSDRIASRLPWAIIPVVVIVVGLVARLVSDDPIFEYLPLFGLGMLAFESRHSQGLSAIVGSKAFGHASLLGLLGAMIAWHDPTRAALPFYFAFFIAVANGYDVFGLLRKPAALVLGELSYSIYLLHGIVLSMLFVDGAAAFARMDYRGSSLLAAPAMVLVVGIAVLTHVAIERPFISFGRIVSHSLFKRSGLAAPLEAGR